MPIADLTTLVNATAQNLSQLKGLSVAYSLLGGAPSIAGYTALINENNTTNFGAGAGPVFNDENVYINVLNALYQGNADAKTAFDAIVGGGATLSDKLELVYNSLIPTAARTDAGLAYVKSQAAFYEARAAELGVAGANGPALVAYAALAKIAVDNDIGGLGDTVNDLVAAVQDGSAALPEDGAAFTPLETADGTNFDTDDVVTDPNKGDTFTLTTGVDAGDPFTGGAQADTFFATEATLSSADALDGAGGTDTLRYTSSGGAPINEAGFTAVNIENVEITSDAVGGTTFDLTGVSNVAHVTNTNSSNNLNLVGSGNIVDVSMSAVSGGNTNVTYKAGVVAGTTDTQNLTLNGVESIGATAVSSFSANGIETLNVMTTGGASQLVGLNTGAATVNVTGDQNFSVTNALAGATKIDASKFTGNLSVVAASGGADVVATGGTGMDMVDFSAGFTKDDSFDGGDGIDTIGLTQAVASGPLGGTLTNVEQLQVTDPGTGSIDMDNFAGVTKVIYNAGLGGNSDLKDAVTGIMVDVNASTAGNSLKVDLKADGATDEVSFNLNNVAAGQTLGTLDADDAETVNIAVADGTGAPMTGSLTVANLQMQDATKIALSGDAALTIANANDPATPVLAEIDASKMTDKVSVSGVDLAAGGATVTLGSADDIFNVATASGADTFTLGEGSDKIFYNAVAQSSGAKVDTVTDFVAGTDDIDLTGLGIVASNQFVGTFANFGAAQGAVNAGGPLEAVFQADTNTLWVDVNNDGTLNANDLQVILTGVTSLAATDLNIAGVGNTIDLTAAAADVSTTTPTTQTNATNFATNENDTITASNTDMVGSAINGLLGTDSLTISGGGLGVFNFADTNGAGAGTPAVVGVETIVLGDGPNTITGLDGLVTSVTGGNNIDDITASNPTGATGVSQTFNLGLGNDILRINAAQLGQAAAGANPAVQAVANFGQNGTDTLFVTSAGAVNLNGGPAAANTALMTGLDVINLTGASQLAYATTANLVVNTGNDDTTVNTAGVGTDTVSINGTAMTADTLTIVGNDNYVVTGTTGDNINAAGQTAGTLAATLGAGAATVTTSAAAVSRTINADALTAGQVLTLVGAGDTTVGLVAGDLTATAHTGNNTVNVTAGGGTNTINLGAGNDILNIATLTNGDASDGGNGTDIANVTGAGAATTDLDGLTNYETINLINQAGNLTLGATVSDTGETVTINQTGTVGNANIDGTGVNGALIINGDGGSGTFTGGAFNDTLNGNGGNDILLGLAGNDTLNGGAGIDTLNGGAGTDTLTGGTGADAFVIASGGVTPIDVDRITDFSLADGDDVDVSIAAINIAVADLVEGAGNTDVAAADSGSFATFANNGGVVMGATNNIAAVTNTTGINSYADINTGVGITVGNNTVAGDAIMFAFYDADDTDMVVGYITNAGADAVFENGSQFTEIARLDMTAVEYTGVISSGASFDFIA